MGEKNKKQSSPSAKTDPNPENYIQWESKKLLAVPPTLFDWQMVHVIAFNDQLACSYSVWQLLGHSCNSLSPR